MKKFIVNTILFLFFVGNAHASELVGKISTNPNNINDIESSIEHSGGYSLQTGNGYPISNILKDINEKKEKDKINIKRDQDEPAINKESKKEKRDSSIVRVLGIVGYADGMLLRGTDDRIFIIKKQMRKYIPSLNELQRYAGRTIFDVDNDEISDIPIYEYHDGELVRMMGTEKIYVIENGKCLHIISLEILKNKYSGKEINNLKKDEIKKYF